MCMSSKLSLILLTRQESYRKLKETNEKLSADLADSYRRLEHAHPRLPPPRKPLKHARASTRRAGT